MPEALSPSQGSAVTSLQITAPICSEGSTEMQKEALVFSGGFCVMEIYFGVLIKRILLSKVLY